MTLNSAPLGKRTDQGEGVNAPASFGSRGTTTSATSVEIKGDYATKKKARRAFLDQVQRLEDAGRTYDQAWSEAQITEPGKSAYLAWRRGADAEKNAAR